MNTTDTHIVWNYLTTQMELEHEKNESKQFPFQATFSGTLIPKKYKDNNTLWTDQHK